MLSGSSFPSGFTQRLLALDDRNKPVGHLLDAFATLRDLIAAVHSLSEFQAVAGLATSPMGGDVGSHGGISSSDLERIQLRVAALQNLFGSSIDNLQGQGIDAGVIDQMGKALAQHK